MVCKKVLKEKEKMFKRKIAIPFMKPKKVIKLKKKIPKALREQVWISHFGKTFEHSCYIDWCSNNINVFDYECGHNIPESKGGETKLDNLYPICSRCNKSMNNNYTIEEWNKKGKSVNDKDDKVVNDKEEKSPEKKEKKTRKKGKSKSYEDEERKGFWCNIMKWKWW